MAREGKAKALTQNATIPPTLSGKTGSRTTPSQQFEDEGAFGGFKGMRKGLKRPAE